MQGRGAQSIKHFARLHRLVRLRQGSTDADLRKAIRYEYLSSFAVQYPDSSIILLSAWRGRMLAHSKKDGSSMFIISVHLMWSSFL